MASSGNRVGPDLVIAGAARSGTTQLAARMALHPEIDACAVKEPNYFSREFDKGNAWYDSYFKPRSPSLVRMDASVSYTFPQYPDALRRLADEAPDAQVVYVARDPIDRAVSHYLLYRYYFGHESARDFASALRTRQFYQDVSDYGRWLGDLHAVYPDEQLLVVPFRAVTTAGADVANVLFRQLGLSEPPEVDEAEVRAHQHNVVTFRSETVRRMTRVVRHSRAYPMARRALGAHTVKRVRSLLTRVPEMPTAEQALASCDARQRAELADLRARAEEAVGQELVRQDARLGLAWAELWGPSVRTS